MKKAIFLCFALVYGLISISALAQLKPQPTDPTKNGNSTTSKPKPAPQTVETEYQGGIFGYQKKIKGTLTFDDANKRLVFRNKEKKEIIAIPYKSVQVVYASQQSYTPTAATVAGAIPSIYAIPFRFLRGKHQFLTLEFNDPDSDVRGGTSFRIDSKELTESMVTTLGEKAELKQRGDAFYRPRQEIKQIQ
jgi:hypothetical protein